tara:strand:+ start:2883 stop:3215 length:333 start_codon:yes stop_codon:yes gene_type:complete
MNTITRTRAKELIKESKGLIFSTTFIKKDNTVRTLTSRTGKQYKSKTGKAAPYKAEDYNLIPLYDMRKKAFRMLNLNTLLTLSINKEKYLIEQQQVSHFEYDKDGNNIII